jgi:hypothetical protein
MQIPAQIAGIEIGEDAVRVAVVRTGGRAPRVVELAEVALSGAGPEVSAMAVREAVSRLKSKPAGFVLSAPASWSVLRLLKVPFRSRRKITAAVPFELEPTLAFPIEDLIVDHLLARTLAGETEVLAVGVRRELLMRQVAALRDAGLRVDGVYLDALALTSLWAGLRKRESAPRAVLHFRPREALLGVVEGARLTYLRRLDMDPATFRANPAGAALEVRNLLRAYAAERGAGVVPSGLSLSGAQLHEAGRTIFEAEIDVPVRYDDLAAELPGFADHRGDAPGESDEFNRWSGPIAAAYSAAGGPFSVNFLRNAADPGLARVAMASCLAAAIVLVAYLGLVYLDYRKDRAALESIGEAVWGEVEATYPELAQKRPGNDPGAAAALALMQDAAIKESDRSQGVSLERFSAPPLLDVLMEITTALESTVAEIVRMSQRPSSKEITIEGVVQDSAQYNHAIERLDQSPRIDVIRDRSTRNNEGGKDTFVLRVKVV